MGFKVNFPTEMPVENQPKPVCKEASRLFEIYLSRLRQLQEAIDYAKSTQPSEASGANIQVNLDLAHNAARDARQAYFHHCHEHGCRA